MNYSERLEFRKQFEDKLFHHYWKDKDLENLEDDTRVIMLDLLHMYCSRVSNGAITIECSSEYLTNAIVDNRDPKETLKFVIPVDKATLEEFKSLWDNIFLEDLYNESQYE